MILVIGATGNIGSEVVKQLSTWGETVRALVRDPESHKAIAIGNPNVELFAGDVTRPQTLSGAFNGVQKVFLLTPAHPDLAQHQGNVIEAARRAAVKHVVKISAIGAGLDVPVSFGRWHARAEQLLQESGLAFTILRPHFFMQNTRAFAATIAADRALYAPVGDGRIAMVDTRDVAAVASVVLSQDGHTGRTYELTGPEALSFREVVRKIADVTLHPVSYVDTSPEDAQQGMVAAGMPDWMAQGLVEVYAVFRAGHGAQVTSAVQDITGREPRSFDQFAREHAFTFGA